MEQGEVELDFDALTPANAVEAVRLYAAQRPDSQWGSRRQRRVRLRV